MLARLKQALAQSEQYFNNDKKKAGSDGRNVTPGRGRASGGEGEPLNGGGRSINAYRQLQHFSILLDRKLPSFREKALVKQHLQRITDRRANVPFAAAVFEDVADFLVYLDLKGEAEREALEQSGWPVAQAVAWYLWARDQGWMQDARAYLVQMARKQKPPPEQYYALVTLPYLLWHLYAFYWGLPSTHRPDESAMVGFPHFDVWSDLYAGRVPGGLPFRVGEGIGEVAEALRPAGREEPPREQAAPTFSDRALWQSVLTQLRKHRDPAVVALLDQIELTGRANNAYTFRVPHEQAREAIETRLLEAMIRHMTRITGHSCQVELVLPQRPKDATPWQLPQFDDAQAWRLTLDELALQMTKATFNSWLKDAVLLRVVGDRYQIGLRNQYAKEWVEQRLRPMIVSTLSTVVGRPVRIEFVVVEPDKEE